MGSIFGNLFRKSPSGEVDPDKLPELKTIGEEYERTLQILTKDVNQLDVRTDLGGKYQNQDTTIPQGYILISGYKMESIKQSVNSLNEITSRLYNCICNKAEPTPPRAIMVGGSSSTRSSQHGRSTTSNKQSVSVQLYSQREDILSPFEITLQTKLREYGIDLHLNKRGDPSSFSPHELGLVLCLASSRLGTNVKSAMSGIQESNKTGLVILHHRDEHNLPTQPSARLLPEFRPCFGDIFDMVYLKDRGLYECPFNTKALDCIVGFITKNA